MEKNNKKLRQLLLLIIFVLLFVGCGIIGANTEANSVDEENITLIDDVVDEIEEEPTATDDTEESGVDEELAAQINAELEGFAEEFLSLHFRLAEGTVALLTATEEEWPAAMDSMVQLNEDVQNVEVPEDNEVAQLLMGAMAACTSNFYEDMSISDYISSNALSDCSQYINIYKELLGEE